MQWLIIGYGYITSLVTNILQNQYNNWIIFASQFALVIPSQYFDFYTRPAITWKIRSLILHPVSIIDADNPNPLAPGAVYSGVYTWIAADFRKKHI